MDRRLFAVFMGLLALGLVMVYSANLPLPSSNATAVFWSQMRGHPHAPDDWTNRLCRDAAGADRPLAETLRSRLRVWHRLVSGGRLDQAGRRCARS